MKNQLTKSSLTPARKRLIDLMLDINYGRIEQLTVCAGEPEFLMPSN